MIKILKSELFTRNAAKIICEPFLKGNLIPSKNTKTFINDNWEDAYYEFFIPHVAKQESKVSLKIVRNRQFKYKFYPYNYVKDNIKEDGKYILIDDETILKNVKIVQEKNVKRNQFKNAYKFRNEMVKHILDEYLESIGITTPSVIHEKLKFLFVKFELMVNGEIRRVLIKTQPTNYEKEMALPIDKTIFRVVTSPYYIHESSRTIKKNSIIVEKQFRCGLDEIESKLKEHFKIDTCQPLSTNVNLKDVGAEGNDDDFSWFPKRI